MYKYDLILGEDWIYHHSPIGLNLKTRQLSITVNGNETITFLDDKLSDHHQIIGAPKMCKLIKRKAITEFIMLRTHQTSTTQEQQHVPTEIQHLLDQYSDIFQEPQHLPPVRSIVTQRAY